MLDTTTTRNKADALPSPTTEDLETTTTSNRPLIVSSSVPNSNANTVLHSRSVLPTRYKKLEHFEISSRSLLQRCATNADCPSTHECQVLDMNSLQIDLSIRFQSDHAVCCPRPQAICSQPLRLGDCKQSVRRYWYNAVTRACEIFDYTGKHFSFRRILTYRTFKGCQGNDNNFETLLECQNTCENIIRKIFFQEKK